MNLENKLFLSDFQRKVLLTDPNKLILIGGRGTGKSTEIIAGLSLNRVQDMPGACFALLGNTYVQVQQRTLASTVTGWAKRGFIEGKHWKIGKPKKSWGKPLFTPLDWEKVISTYTGTIFVPVSLDRPGLANSYTFWGIYGDEAKMFDYEIMKKDVLPTLRAPIYHFPNSAHNRSLILTTSMPDLPEGQWLLDFEKMQTPKLNALILRYSEELQLIKYKYLKSTNERTRDRLKREIGLREIDLEKMRKHSIMFEEVSTLSNIDILDIDYIKQQKELLGHEFKTEILNVRPSGTINMFYQGLSRKHFYTSYNYSYIDGFGVLGSQASNNYKRDSDHDERLPLLMGFDFGSNFNGCVVAQNNYSERMFRVLNNFYVEYDGIIEDVVKKFDSYYGGRKYKVVHLYYDNSGNNRQGGIVKQKPAQELKTQLESRGWQCTLMTKGGANMPHHVKYYIWQAIFNSQGNYDAPTFLINEVNAEETKLSMKFAGTKRGKDNLIQKDKSSEQNSSIKPRFATHLSDCIDVIVCNIFRNLQRFGR